MIDELYRVNSAGREYDVIDFEDGNHIVIDDRKVYRQWVEKCVQPCLCESRYLCSCGSEDFPGGECPHIRAVNRFYQVVAS